MEDFLINVGALLAVIGIPLLAIAIVISPFIITKKYFKEFTASRVIICLIISAVLLVLVYHAIYLFIDWGLAVMGRAFLSTF